MQLFDSLLGKILNTDKDPQKTQPISLSKIRQELKNRRTLIQRQLDDGDFDYAGEYVELTDLLEKMGG